MHSTPQTVTIPGPLIHPCCAIDIRCGHKPGRCLFCTVSLWNIEDSFALYDMQKDFVLFCKMSISNYLCTSIQESF